jgi:hypothetical protein
MAGIAKQFEKFIKILREQAELSADSLIGQDDTKSENLEAPPNTSVDTNDWNAEEVRLHFSRQDIYQDYIGCIEKSGTIAEAIGYKAQGDFLAQLERDYKLKKLGRIRSVFIAASRRFSHGLPNGVITKGIFRDAERWFNKDKAAKDSSGTLIIG